MKVQTVEPGGEPTLPGPEIEVADIQILAVGTKLASLTIVARSFFNLEIRGCLLHQDAKGNRWVQFPSRAYIKPDASRGFETTHTLPVPALKRALTDAVFALYESSVQIRSLAPNVIDRNQAADSSRRESKGIEASSAATPASSCEDELFDLDSDMLLRRLL